MPNSEKAITGIDDDLQGHLLAALSGLDDIRAANEKLNKRESTLYYHIERYLFPANEMFSKKNRKATKREYIEGFKMRRA
jgi:hypothetical protein